MQRVVGIVVQDAVHPQSLTRECTSSTRAAHAKLLAAMFSNKS